MVASACVLTQLLDSVVLSLDAGHSRFRELLLAVRNTHLRLLVELVAPGGLAVLFTDVVSSDTLPELATIPVPHLPNVIAEQVAQRNFFSGVNPQLLKTWFDEDATIGPAIEQVQLVRPWRWQVGPRTYAVCAIKVLRRRSTVG